ncbi:hypothetical protein BH23ACT9_BH23ACT9_33380 [soil metagenome]
MFRLLGPVRAVLDGDDVALGGKLARGLLAILLLDAGMPVGVDRIIAGLWHDPPTSARATLQTMVYRLRRSTRRPITQVGGAYRLDATKADTDIGVLSQALDASEGGASSRQSLQLLHDVLRLRRGEPLADLTEMPFAAGMRTELVERVGRAVRQRARLRLELGEAERAAEELAAAAAPTDERAQGLRATALAASGRTADALAVIARTRAILRDEVGLNLGVELCDLEGRLLDHGLQTRRRPAPGRATVPSASADPHPLRIAGKLALDAGDDRMATAHLRRAVGIDVGRGDIASTLIGLHHLAGALATAGQVVVAALLVGYTRAAADGLGYQLEATNPVDCARTVDTIATGCGPRMEGLLADGTGLSLDTALSLAGVPPTA